MTKVAKKYQGIHANRYSREPLEEKFALEWQKMHRLSGDESVLERLLDDSPPIYRPKPISDRDRLVANTVIQWLGSPVGQCFLRDVMEDENGE